MLTPLRVLRLLRPLLVLVTDMESLREEFRSRPLVVLSLPTPLGVLETPQTLIVVALSLAFSMSRALIRSWASNWAADGGWAGFRLDTFCRRLLLLLLLLLPLSGRDLLPLGFEVRGEILPPPLPILPREWRAMALASASAVSLVREVPLLR